MEKLELTKEYVDMVKRHEEEAFTMVTKIGSNEITEDSKDILVEVMSYASAISVKNKLAQYYYKGVAEEFISQGL